MPYKFPDVLLQRTTAHQIKVRIRQRLLHLGKRTYHQIHAVVGMEPARTDKMRTQRAPWMVAKLRQVHNVWHDGCLQPKLANNIGEIPGGNHQPVRFFQYMTRQRRLFQMVAALSAVVVDQGSLAAQACNHPRRKRRQQERGIRSREDVSHVHVLQILPEGENVQRFADHRTQERNLFHPTQCIRQTRINWNETCLDIRVIFPISDQQVCLHRLAPDITYRRSHKRNPNAGICARF